MNDFLNFNNLFSFSFNHHQNFYESKTKKLCFIYWEMIREIMTEDGGFLKQKSEQIIATGFYEEKF